MWADNEADVDLLGFDYLVDELEVVLTEGRLLPVTVGVAGEWGSGKSSLMRLAGRRLGSDEHRGRFLCVEFSPWRYEDSEDVKAALMATVMDALDEHIRDREVDAGIREKITRLRRWAHAWALPRILVTGGGMAAGLDPAMASLAGEAAQAVASVGVGQAESAALPRSFESVSRFHHEFAAVMNGLGEEVQALVVFVDDLDRCLTPAIVSTFEAIRLFLQAPRTAYVVGAHQRVIQAALDARYPGRGEGDDALGIDYLEKVLQVTVAIPPLSGPESLTYVNLLFAELYTEEGQFSALLEEARRLRAADQLAEAMNVGVASGVLGELRPELVEAFELVERVGPTLARGARGNPRQLKRFLNTLLLRQRTAAKRGAPVKPGVLAKLMLLEERHVVEFEQLYQWQLTASGAPEQLAEAERMVRGKSAKGEKDAATRAAAETWLARPGVRDWVALEPALAGIALSPYFSLARDKLSTATPATRLPGHLQELIVDAQSPIDRDRDAAIARVADLDAEDQAAFATALFAVASREPDSTAMSAASALAASQAQFVDAFFATLSDMSPLRVPIKLPGALALRFKSDARLGRLLDGWSTGPPKLAAAVKLVRGQ
ncbi:MAG: KAP family P-loop NTPase fold protein [Solirubrobacteraceae bacterium]